MSSTTLVKEKTLDTVGLSPKTEKKERLIVVDALRGFTMLGIVLVHCVEHFDFMKEPIVHFLFPKSFDQAITGFTHFFITGKAYSVFALLFGFSFFLQMQNNQNRGIDFRGRFLWRLFILYAIGTLNVLIFKPDILNVYALLGVSMIFFYRVRTSVLLWLSLILVLQIPTIYWIVRNFIDPTVMRTPLFDVQLWLEGNRINDTGTLWEAVRYNFWHGRPTLWQWIIDNGRHLQLIALFLTGIVLGKVNFFEKSEKNSKLMKQILIVSGSVAAVGFSVMYGLRVLNLGEYRVHMLSNVLYSYLNLSLAATVLALFVLVYHRFPKLKMFHWMATYGKMSLTNYVMHDIIGVFFFYGLGLGMYRYFGQTWSFIFGLALFTLQVIASRMWIKRFHYGPLEWLWRALTYLDFSIKFRRKEERTKVTDYVAKRA